MENSPRRLEGTSPSHPVFDYGIGRAIGRNEEMSEWRNLNRFESTSTSYNLSNGHEHQGPRALIDAYGSDKRASNNKPPQVGRMGINGMGNKVASRSWQNTEEEEFDWEDMSPTLIDRGRKNDFLPSSVPLYGSTGARTDFSKLNSSSLESDIRTNHSSQAQLPLLDDSSISAEDSVSLLSVCFSTLSAVPFLFNHFTLLIWTPNDIFTYKNFPCSLISWFIQVYFLS